MTSPYLPPDPTTTKHYMLEQCEAIATNSVILNPLNFVTNGAYLIVGIIVLKLTRTWIERLVGWSLIVLAIGSAWFHATLSPIGNTLDIVGINLVLFSLIAYGSSTLLIESRSHGFESNRSWNVVATVAVVGLAIIMGVFRREVSFFNSTVVSLASGAILLLLILLSWPLTKVSRSQAGWQMTAVITFAVAAVFKFSDGRESLLFNWCNEYGPLQPHAIWHVLSALGLWALYMAFSQTKSIAHQGP